MPDNWIGRILFKDGDVIVDDAGVPMHSLLNLSVRKGLTVSVDRLPKLYAKLAAAQGITPPALAALPYIPLSLSPNGTQISMISELGDLDLFYVYKGLFDYDFSDKSTLWRDAAKTSPVTEVGQTVARVTNKIAGLEDVFNLSVTTGTVTYAEDANGRGMLVSSGAIVSVLRDAASEALIDITATTALHCKTHIPSMGDVDTVKVAFNTTSPTNYIASWTIYSGTPWGRIQVELAQGVAQTMVHDTYSLTGPISAQKLMLGAKIIDTCLSTLNWTNVVTLDYIFQEATLYTGDHIVTAPAFGLAVPTSIKGCFYKADFVISDFETMDVTSVDGSTASYSSSGFFEAIAKNNYGYLLNLNGWEVSTVSKPDEFSSVLDYGATLISYNNSPRWKTSARIYTMSFNDSIELYSNGKVFTKLTSKEDTALYATYRSLTNSKVVSFDGVIANKADTVPNFDPINPYDLSNEILTFVGPSGKYSGYRVYIQITGVGWTCQSLASTSSFPEPYVSIPKGTYWDKLILTNVSDEEMNYQKEVLGNDLLAVTPLENEALSHVGILPTTTTTWTLLETWNMANIKSLAGTLMNIQKSLTGAKINLGNWDLSKLEVIRQPFTTLAGSAVNASNNVVGMEFWNTGPLKDMESAFTNVNFVSQPIYQSVLANLSTGQVTNFKAAFYKTVTQTTGNIFSNFSTANGQIFDSMFAYSDINKEIGNLDFSKTVSAPFMFAFATYYNIPMGNSKMPNIVATQLDNFLYNATIYAQDLSTWTLKGTGTKVSLGSGNAMSTSQLPNYGTIVSTT